MDTMAWTLDLADTPTGSNNWGTQAFGTLKHHIQPQGLKIETFRHS